TMPTGGGGVCLGVHKATREAAGVAFGERVAIEIERDEALREVAVPAELRRALGEDADASERFDALSPTHRREYAQWVAEAKRPETMVKRIEQTLERLRGGH
ncbi:MAG: YdeI/OmpD-associated family protein, partial [Candidatus Dormiibacterota bacterium]